MSEKTARSLKEAFAEVKTAAESGDAKAYALLAHKYYEGSGTERDLKRAELWAKKAVEEGDRQLASQVLYWLDKELEDQYTDEKSESMKILNKGSFLMQQKKYAEALKCFLKAAKMGHPSAMNNASFCYFHGLGTKQNHVAAYEWMKMAAEAGYASAYYPLAAKYYVGSGTVKSMEKAETWAKKALEEENQFQKEAQVLLGMIRK